MIIRAGYTCLLLALSLSLAYPPAVEARGDCRGQQPTDWQMRIADDSEPGQRLTVEGRVLDADGKTGLAGVTIFAFHTDARGYYSEQGMDESNARLCGLVVTDPEGRYRFDTIRPATYATGGVPAHIHFQVWGPDVKRQTLVLNFEGDPLLGERGRDASDNPSWARIRPLTTDEAGTLHVQRDLRLSSR